MSSSAPTSPVSTPHRQGLSSTSEIRKVIAAIYRPKPPPKSTKKKGTHPKSQRKQTLSLEIVAARETPQDEDLIGWANDSGSSPSVGSCLSNRSRSFGSSRSKSWNRLIPAQSVVSSANGPFHPRPFLLLRVYVRIKKLFARFRERHPTAADELSISRSMRTVSSNVVSRYDSMEWKHIFLLDRFTVDEQTTFSRGKLHLSSSHLCLHADSLGAEPLLIRLVDVSDVVPNDDGGLTFLFSAKQNALLLGEEDEIQKSVTLRRVSLESSESAQIAVYFFEERSSILLRYVQSFSANVRNQDQTRKLCIVHFNDCYHLPPFKPVGATGIAGGVARFHTMLSRIREHKNPLVVFSGDFMGPSLMSVLTKGKQMVDALNFLGVHYGCLGNHEFDFGLKCLKEQIHGFTQGKHVHSGSQTTWVMTNMTEGDGVTPLGCVEKRALFTWNGVRVGIVGLCENWLPQCVYLAANEAKYYDIFEVGESEAKKLKEQGADLVLALTHCRLPIDRLVTERCPSIDYLLGGHDHFYKSEPKRRLLKSGQEFEYLSLIDVEIRLKDPPKFRVQCEPITFDIPESPYMMTLLGRYEEKMAEKLGKPIGRTEEPLDSSEEAVRFKEGTLTNFILDIIENESGAEFAVLGGAAIAGKEVKPPGLITIGDVFNWFPNETRIMTMKLLGSTVEKMLNVMVREVPAEAPSFPHPSSRLSFVLNTIKKPTIVQDIRVSGVPLDSERWYTVAVEEFVGLGKAKYKMVGQEGEVLVTSDNAPQLVNWVLDFFQKQKQDTPESLQEARIRSVVKVVSSATHLGVDMDMSKSQKFIRSLVCELLRCDRSAVFLVDNASQELHFFPDGSPAEIRFPKSVGLAGAVATNKEVLMIDDVYNDPRFNQAVDKKTGYRTKSMLACPIVIDGSNCVAVVQAINKDPSLNDGHFDESDQVVLTFLGEQFGYQMRNAEIYQQARDDKLIFAPKVFSVLQMLANELYTESDTALKGLTQKALDLMNVEMVRVVRRQKSEVQYFYLEEGMDDTTQVDVPLESGTAFCRAATTGCTIRIDDPSQAASALRREVDITTLQWKNMIVCPIMSPSMEVLGAVLWINKTKSQFDDGDVAAAEYFCRMCGSTLQNLIRLELMEIDESGNVPTISTPLLGRIKPKGGWVTVRKKLREGYFNPKLVSFYLPSGDVGKQSFRNCSLFRKLLERSSKVSQVESISLLSQTATTLSISGGVEVSSASTSVERPILGINRVHGAD